jgi:Outer membrane protein beta-barrel domain
MKKLILLSILLGCSMITFSQEKNLHFGLSANAKITHQNFEVAIFEVGDSQDEFAYSVTGNVYFDLGSNFQLVSGISFSQYQINLVDYIIAFPCDITSSGIDRKNSYIKDNYQTGYIGIPLELRWKVIGETNNLFLQFGLEGLYKIKLDEKRTVFECNEVSEAGILLFTHFYDVSNFLLLSKIGIGYELQLGKKVNLFFEPNVEYSLTDFFDLEPEHSKFFNFGLNTGIVF